MSARRSRIHPELMEALQIVKYSIKQGRGLNFTSGYAWQDELVELELLTDARAHVPEEMTSFKQALARGQKNAPKDSDVMGDGK